MTSYVFGDNIYIVNEPEVFGVKKSVYSLVLMDDIIRAVDNEAFRLGTSRSNLVNRILAEYLSCETPEMRMRSIFGEVTRLIGDSFRVQQQSESALICRTALRYKYHPTLNCRVELKRTPDRFLGRLIVSIRTQNQRLLNECTSFFSYRSEMEERCLAAAGYADYRAAVGEGSFSRMLYNPDSGDCSEAAEAICAYISNLDRALMLWLSGISTFAANQERLEAEYADMLGKCVV